MDLVNAPIFMFAGYALATLCFLVSLFTTRKSFELPGGWLFRLTWIGNSLWLGAMWLESKPIVFPGITKPGALGLAAWALGLVLVVSEIRYRVRWNGFLLSWMNTILMVLVFILSGQTAVDTIDLLRDSGWNGSITTLIWIAYAWFALAGSFALLQLVFDRVPLNWYRMGFVALGLSMVFPKAAGFPTLLSGDFRAELLGIPFGQTLLEFVFLFWLIFAIPHLLGGMIRFRVFQRINARICFVTDWFYRLGQLALFGFLVMTAIGGFEGKAYVWSNPPTLSVLLLAYMGIVGAASLILRNRIRLEPELPHRGSLDAWAFVSLRTGYLILCGAMVLGTVWSYLAVGQLWMNAVFGIAPIMLFLYYTAYIHFRSERQTVDYHHAVWTLWGLCFTFLSSEWLWRLSTL